MKIVITGASGFVGKKLVIELLKQGHIVTGVVRNINSLNDIKSDNLRVVECSFGEYSELANKLLVNNESYDVFYHLAWSGTQGVNRANVKLQLENVVMAEEAVKQAHKIGCKRFVYSGSIMEYEALSYINKDFSNPGKGHIYSVSKLAADNISKITALDLGLEYINTVISNIYAEDEVSDRFFNSIVRKMLINEEINMTEGKQLYDFIYILDAVRGMALAGCHGKFSQYYYIGNREQKCLSEFVKNIKQYTNSCSIINFGAIEYNGPLTANSELNTNSLYDEFKFIPEITLEEGINIIRG